ncbi:DUF7674 family protein [Paradevosia shaoguanensis]|uniref:DUF7674 family protein n=1 Tax=Paradevosia shaoguanensis TaxID=1335043 RepID=UPI001933FE49|nr:hypothetical protein [Paradevosia shaoguanensis]
MSRLIEDLDRACPGLDVDEIADGIPYAWMGYFVRHIILARLAGRDTELRAVFAVIERTLEQDNPSRAANYDSTLAVVGFLEGLQNEGLHPEDSKPADFHAYLGPKSRREWDMLNKFWGQLAGTRPV